MATVLALGGVLLVAAKIGTLSSSTQALIVNTTVIVAGVYLLVHAYAVSHIEQHVANHAGTAPSRLAFRACVGLLAGLVISALLLPLWLYRDVAQYWLLVPQCLLLLAYQEVQLKALLQRAADVTDTGSTGANGQRYFEWPYGALTIFGGLITSLILLLLAIWRIVTGFTPQHPEPLGLTAVWLLAGAACCYLPVLCAAARTTMGAMIQAKSEEARIR
jgi:hypothetical protein